MFSAPPEEALLPLIRAVELGDILEIRTFTARMLDSVEPKFVPFFQKLSNMAKNIQILEMQNFIRDTLDAKQP